MSDDSADKEQWERIRNHFPEEHIPDGTSWTQADPDPTCFRSCMHRKLPQILGADLNCSESSSLKCLQLDQDSTLKRVYSHVEEGCTNVFTSGQRGAFLATC